MIWGSGSFPSTGVPSEERIEGCTNSLGGRNQEEVVPGDVPYRTEGKILDTHII